MCLCALGFNFVPLCLWNIGTAPYFSKGSLFPVFPDFLMQKGRNYDIRNFLKEEMMRENLTVSSRGQITLPAALRKRLGIETGGVVIAEERQGELVLRPAAILEIEAYSDADIARWDAEDRLDETDRQAILQRFEGGS
ncbi:MAG: hypothetical protein CO012_04765 [Syntrophobacterales bacterium CG_4_8_14_3_um_filter_49_14]|nr:MAG: hypothetical protein COX52_06115 [Syntrophobacterales bacterium CG23_combo_of_CG06-09_8_20_14_all_48_27]PJC74923.1 MAG: hypothetical protein CO012_04765 [Syntrophobacterales bacterium CG_4_8_14_3_um_filter_49_14]